MGRLIALTLALLAGALIAWSQARLPAPVPASAPAQVFSAERAFATVREIAAAPHPIGSAANHQVRDRLLARMAELGLSPRVSRADALTQEGGELVGASTENLIGVLPGRDGAKPALALMAHYDSRPAAPGAADDGSGVAAVLETVRAIRARGVPARDVAVILTDGEEACLCGAKAVFSGDPISRRVGFVLNLESSGSSGRALMFETGDQNAGAVDLFRRTAVRPVSGALFSAVYAHLPHGTDFTLPRRAGLPGLNYAFNGGAFDYHMPTDTPEHLNLGSLQDLGDQALTAAGAAAFAPTLPGKGPDHAFGVVFGHSMIAYPAAWGWGLLALAAGLLALALVRARGQERLPLAALARGVGVGVYALAGAACVLHLAVGVATVGDAEETGARRLLALAGRWETAVMLIAVGFLLFAAAEAARGRRTPALLVPLMAALGSCALARQADVFALASGGVAVLTTLAAVGRGPLSRPAAWGGVLALALLVALALQLLLPAAAYAIAWPTLLGATAAAATALGADRRLPALAVMALIAGLVAGWAGLHAHLVVEVVAHPELLILPLLMVAPSLWPLAQPEPGAPPARLPGRALLVAGGVLALAVRLANPWDARHPQAGYVTYQLDQDMGRARWVAPPERRTSWSDAALRVDGGRPSAWRDWTWGGEAVEAAPAKPVSTTPLRLESHRLADGAVVLALTPPPSTRMLSLQLSPDTAVRLAKVGGASADAALAPGRWTQLTWHAPPPDGLMLTLAPGGPGKIALRYAAVLDGPASGATPLPPPPAEVMPVGLSGAARLTGVRTAAW